MARIESMRLMLALAAQEGWPVHHMDVKSAFLNGELVEEVYVRQPPGFTVVGHEDKVLRLDKALYGLRQAPRAWNGKLDETLVALGFSHSASEHAVYARGKGASRLLIFLIFALRSTRWSLLVTRKYQPAYSSCGKEFAGFAVPIASIYPCSAVGRRRQQWWLDEASSSWL
ncbi:hypothetical protein E2562_021853 [Oryza meyeriana var. granulata]|uniref:Reverse transcriptase Ty1/copia-type domain-containing protein n=1 Tax=Oryza meyeriana var. granulata TaxID=110450 RepID=A0A6G1C865_9ORYZ|nr:hypothetical protein E2562_021853 [Oryza meyeriana var. granulata]